MKAYIENIAGFMILISFVQMLMGEKFRRGAGFITGLMLLAALCAPLNGIMPTGVSLPKTETADTAGYESMREKLIQRGIKDALENEISRETGCKVTAELDESNAVGTVRLYGGNAAARQKAADMCGIDIEKVVLEDAEYKE